jgi:hypothetical protein
VKEVVGPLKDINTQLIYDNSSMCELLNEYFGPVFTSENNIALPEVSCTFREDNNHVLSNIEIMQDIISSILWKLNINMAPGVDGLVPKMLVENYDIFFYLVRPHQDCWAIQFGQKGFVDVSPYRSPSLSNVSYRGVF